MSGDIVVATEPEIISMPMEDIKPYYLNPRVNAGAVEQVAASIREYGMVQPIVVDADSIIIVGDTRFRALTLMGATHAPVIVRPLSRRNAKAYRIADNKTGELASWDEDRLRSELMELPDVDLSVWYTQGEIDKLIGDASPRVLNEPSQRSEAETARRSATADQVELLCPTCDYLFYANRSDLATRPGIGPASATLGAEEAKALAAQVVGAPDTESTPDDLPPKARRRRTPRE